MMGVKGCGDVLNSHDDELLYLLDLTDDSVQCHNTLRSEPARLFHCHPAAVNEDSSAEENEDEKVTKCRRQLGRLRLHGTQSEGNPNHHPVAKLKTKR